MKHLSCSATLVFLLACLLLAGCRDQSSSTRTIAVTSSYLECAVRALLGDAVPVTRLAEPGLCPGHFDIRPSQVNDLRHSTLLLRFDFQDSLDRQLSGIPTLSIAAISISGGMCVPESYLQTCRQSADALVRAGLISRAAADERLTAIQNRLTRTGETARATVRQAGLLTRPVLTSPHQADFCRWLGLQVSATLGSADSSSVKQLDSALSAAREARCQWVIANRPEGTQLADRVAGELHARLVVFDNFPDLGPRQSSFDAMLLDNVDHLVGAIPP
jgi:zinc transport system substrate-binding protein